MPSPLNINQRREVVERLPLAGGPPAGIALLDALAADGRLTGHHRLDAVRAHLLELAGDHQAAIQHYQAAAALTASLPERNYLITQAARLREEHVG